MISYDMNQINKQQKQQTENKEQIVNGVNVSKLFGTVEAIKGNPEIAKFNFKAKGKWVNGGHNRTTVNDFYGACQNFKRQEAFVFEKDEPPVLLGEDHGANPVEYVLAALDGCLITSLIYHAAAKGIKIDEVETSFTGDLNLHGFLGLDEKTKIHPTQKPVALMEYLIRTYTNEGETVLDNTMGSGTTGVACRNTGRHFIGIERDPAYFAIAEQRINGKEQQPAAKPAANDNDLFALAGAA